MSWLNEHIDREVSFEMTPLIDIVFNILVFFVTVSSFTVLPDIDLPRAGGGEPPGFELLGPHALVVGAAPDAPLVYGNRRIEWADLPRLLEDDALAAGGAARLTLRIYAHRDGAFARVRRVVSMAAGLGIHDVRIATLPGSGG